MTKNNIILELVHLLKKVYKDDELISKLINNGFLSEDLYKLGFNDDDISLGVRFNFRQP
jgi:hypothetical protein